MSEINTSLTFRFINSEVKYALSHCISFNMLHNSKSFRLELYPFFPISTKVDGLEVVSFACDQEHLLVTYDFFWLFFSAGTTTMKLRQCWVKSFRRASSSVRGYPSAKRPCLLGSTPSSSSIESFKSKT